MYTSLIFCPIKTHYLLRSVEDAKEGLLLILALIIIFTKICCDLKWFIPQYSVPSNLQALFWIYDKNGVKTPDFIYRYNFCSN
jgi:hypothetical protein